MAQSNESCVGCGSHSGVQRARGRRIVSKGKQRSLHKLFGNSNLDHKYQYKDVIGPKDRQAVVGQESILEAFSVYVCSGLYARLCFWRKLLRYLLFSNIYAESLSFRIPMLLFVGIVSALA